jgi:hypothetical protein
MAAARAIKDVGPQLAWLTIEDDGGREWRYRRVGAADTAEVAHVEGHYLQGHPIRAALVRDDDGHPLLQQPGPGLPRTLIIDHVDDPTNPLLSVLNIDPKERYELVGH